MCLYNSLPNKGSGLTTLNFFTRNKSDYCDFRNFHVLGFPVSVLEPKLQNDQKLPIWNCRARLGRFLGFPDEHSSLVANVQHLSTRYIPPRFHSNFDYLFEMFIRQGDDDIAIEEICSDIFYINQDWYAKWEFGNCCKSHLLAATPSRCLAR